MGFLTYDIIFFNCLQVLSQSDKQICFDFVKRGLIGKAMWQWFRGSSTLEDWVETGREQCKLTSALMIEQLRLWKVCIRYGYCITCFADFFPAMCLWLSLPAFDKLIENSVLAEFVSITREAYLVLEALAQRLPVLHSANQINNQGIDSSNDAVEAWSWSHATPMVDLAIKWLALKNIPSVSSFVANDEKSADALDSSDSCMIWVISAVVHMLASMFDRIAPRNNRMQNKCTHLPWIPQFVPKVGLEVIRNGFLNFLSPTNVSLDSPTEGGSLVGGLCGLRQQSEIDASLSSLSCLHGVIRLASSIDLCVQGARNVCSVQSHEAGKSETTEKILEEGLLKWAKNDLMGILTVLIALVSAEWHLVQSVEMFGRGGPAPGIGFGWGSSCGGFWSENVLIAQMDARLILELCELLPVMTEEDFAFVEGLDSKKSAATMALASQGINSVLAVCLIAGPRDRDVLERALDILLQVPVLKFLNQSMHLFLHGSKGTKSFEWQHKEGDYELFSEVLNAHFRSRWMSIKKKSSDKEDRGNNNLEMLRKNNVLETIHEDQETSAIPSKSPDYSYLRVEWARQRLPLPMHWFLSAVCSIGDTKNSGTYSSTNICDVAKSGLFLLLGLESLSYLLGSEFKHSTISSVPLVWKLHALSMALHANMDVLDDERSRDVFETLQDVYGQHLDKLRDRGIIKQPDENGECLVSSEDCDRRELLNFQSQVHESYTTFVENLVEQFGAISYGDVIFGRQVALYLHQSVVRPVRLAAWNALSNAHVLELLPPIDKCFAEPEGYLMPAEVLFFLLNLPVYVIQIYASKDCMVFFEVCHNVIYALDYCIAYSHVVL